MSSALTLGKSRGRDCDYQGWEEGDCYCDLNINVFRIGFVDCNLGVSSLMVIFNRRISDERNQGSSKDNYSGGYINLSANVFT